MEPHDKCGICGSLSIRKPMNNGFERRDFCPDCMGGYYDGKWYAKEDWEKLIKSFEDGCMSPKLVKLLEALAAFDAGPNNADGLLNINLYLLIEKRVAIYLTFDAFMRNFGKNCEVLPCNSNDMFEVYKEVWGMAGFYAEASKDKVIAAGLILPDEVK